MLMTNPQSRFGKRGKKESIVQLVQVINIDGRRLKRDTITLQVLQCEGYFLPSQQVG